MSRFAVLLVIITLSAGCKNELKTPIQSDKVSHEVHQMLQNYHADMNNYGLKAEFKYLDSTDQFFWVPPAYTSALNYDTVRSILLKNAATLTSVHFHWDTLIIFPLTDEIANFTGIVAGRMIDTSGQSNNISIIESGTVIKREDGWKLLNGQSALLPD